MKTVAGVVVFQAKPGLGDEVARRVSAALPTVETESGTLLWLVLRSHADEDRIFLVDLFDGDQSLAAHMNGDAASLIFATVPELLIQDVELHPSAVVAAKPAR
jgi:quinol monooxygenase YgiN